MNFRELLDVADYNRTEAKYEAKVKRYSSDLPPPKKNPRSGVQSDGIRKFLEKKKAEEDARLAEARKQKEQLLALRAQNSKNNKKAKIMASRTKDNDFSKIRLTEDEIQSKKKIENALQRKHLADKVERMKVRIEMEEKEKLLPRKRKRKSKHGDGGEHIEDPHFSEDRMREEARDSKHESKHKNNSSVRKAPRPPPPAMSFSELLKVAEAKQHEPVIIPQKKKEDEKLLTKKQRRIEEQEEERLRRKQERQERGDSSTNYRSSNGLKHSSSDKQSLQNGKVAAKKPVVIHVEKDTTSRDSQNVKNHRNGTSISKAVPVPKTDKSKLQSDRLSKVASALRPYTNHDREKSSKGGQDEKLEIKQRSKDESKSVPKKPSTLVKPPQKKNSVKIAPIAAAPVKEVPTIDTDAIAAAIEKRIREKLEKEMEEKFAAKFAASLQSTSSKPVENNPPVKVKNPNGTHPSVNGKSLSKLPPNHSTVSKKPQEKSNSKPSMPNRKSSGPPPPEKRPFHPNPYLDPPRKRLEPIRQSKPPPKRRIESDDSDDDMSDFIDNSNSQNDEDYSKYIQEIFRYDRNRYRDEDDDDIVETSFAEQMKEETRSAKLGYLEDLEEERKLKEMEKKRKKKLKK